MYKNQASEIAYDYIVDQIRSGIWKPGDKIATEVQLVESIGAVSYTHLDVYKRQVQERWRHLVMASINF